MITIHAALSYSVKAGRCAPPCNPWAPVRLCAIAVLVLDLSCVAPTAQDDRPAGSFAPPPKPVAKSIEVEGSIVRVRIPIGERTNPRAGTIETTYETATGIVLDTSGLILTVAHGFVTSHSRTASVIRPGEPQAYRARVVHVDPQADLALLKVDLVGLLPMPLSSSSSGLAGERVTLRGFSTNEAVADRSGVIASAGVVSRTNVRIEGADQFRYRQHMLEIQAWSDYGFSGGPVLDADGNCCGLIALRLEKASGHWGGYTMAIPVEAIREYLDAHKQLLHD